MRFQIAAVAAPVTPSLDYRLIGVRESVMFFLTPGGYRYSGRLLVVASLHYLIHWPVKGATTS